MKDRNACFGSREPAPPTCPRFELEPQDPIPEPVPCQAVPLGDFPQPQPRPMAQSDDAGSTLPSTTNLPDAVWHWVFKDAQRYARRQVARYRWRGAKDGVLPQGYDSNSIAAEAILELLQRKPAKKRPNPPPNAPSPAPQASVSPRARKRPPRGPPPPAGWETECRQLQEDLRQRVRRQVNRLWHLKEKVLMVQMEELDRIPIDQGETLSVMEAMPSEEPSPLEILIQNEEQAEFEQFKTRIRALLGDHGRLLNLFNCFCGGIFKPKDQARRLKLAVSEIQDLQRRLRRTLAGSGCLPASAESKNQAK